MLQHVFDALCHVSKLSLHCFFKPVNKKHPDPNEELSATISPASIREANREVVTVEDIERGKRKPYKVSD